MTVINNNFRMIPKRDSKNLNQSDYTLRNIAFAMSTDPLSLF